MIKCEVIENFSLNDFDKLKNIQRKGVDVKGQLVKGDVFECDEKMAKYLTGDNALNKAVVKIIEVEPKEEVEEEKEESITEEVVEEKHIEKPKKKKKSKK